MVELRGIAMRKALLATTFLAALGFVTAANAAVVITLGSGANYDAFDNDAVGSTSGMTDTQFGEVTWTTTPGTLPGFDSSVADTSVDGKYLQPLDDKTNYVFAQEGGSVTLNFAAPLTSVTIYWGSPDSYNTITLSNGDVITGAEVAAALGISDTGLNGDSRWVTITDAGKPFTSLVATSGSPAFEFDLAGAVPEPATWAMMFLGFAGLGYAAFRRSAKGAATAGAI
jgi:PEP-CTERM motif